MDSGGSVVIREMLPGDATFVMAASPLFDSPVRADTVADFLADPAHHLLIAYIAEHPVGFVSGVALIHPDKGTEMFLYELSVDEAQRGRGIGKSLVNRLVEIAKKKGCYGMWVLADVDNDAGLRTYKAAGGVREADTAIIVWTFDRSTPGGERDAGGT